MSLAGVLVCRPPRRDEPGAAISRQLQRGGLSRRPGRHEPNGPFRGANRVRKERPRKLFSRHTGTTICPSCRKSRTAQATRVRPERCGLRIHDGQTRYRPSATRQPVGFSDACQSHISRLATGGPQPLKVGPPAWIAFLYLHKAISEGNCEIVSHALQAASRPRRMVDYDRAPGPSGPYRM